MELNELNVEVIVSYSVAETPDCQLRDLSDFQLALIGGGVGEISPY